MKNILSLILCVTASLAQQVCAETVDELNAQLDVQKQIIELQRQRIESLEAQLSGRKIAPPMTADERPEVLSTDPEADRALARALTRRGSAVLAPYVVELTPGLFWMHSGSDALYSTDDIYGAALDVRTGLPGAWMIGVGVPYLYRDINGIGDNAGVGDLSVTVWKSVLSESGSGPSLVAGLRYTSPTGEDPGDTRVALGNGFRQLTTRFSTVKTIDPVAFFGDVSYSHYLDEEISGLNVERGDSVGVGFGATLAVTPDVSLSVGLDFVFEDEVEIEHVDATGSGTTLGQLEIGAGVVLARDIFLNIFGSFGVTDDSPDMTLGVSLPVRF